MRPLYSVEKWDAILNIIRVHVDLQDELTVMKAISDKDADVMIAASLWMMAANPLFYPAIKNVDNAPIEGENPDSDDNAIDECQHLEENKQIDIDIIFIIPGFITTPPQLQSSLPLNSSHSQPMVAPDDAHGRQHPAAKELAITKRSSDMTTADCSPV